MKLADKLVYLRKKQGLSQLKLAEMMNVSRQAVSRWETGIAVPSAENLKYLGNLYNVSLDYLFNDGADELEENEKATDEIEDEIASTSDYGKEYSKKRNDILYKEVSQDKLGGLNAFQIKIIACFCMTIDHIGAFGNQYYAILRIVGRAAAPLFLFILVQSIRYTKNRTKLLKRLYFAGVLVGLLDTVFNALNIFGIHDFGNILFTYFYVGLYVTIIEKTVIAIRGRNIRDCAKWLGVFGLWLLPSVAYRILDIIVPTGLPVQQRILVQGFRDALLPSIEHLDYGLGFVALGLFLYFVKKKTLQGIVYFLFCTVCMCGAAVARRNPDILINSAFATLYFDPMQCCMILALPIMLLYNQKKGKNVKGFFYWYYPIHRFLIIITYAMLGY